MKALHKKRMFGFTIIELMVSMLAFAILALATGSMLYFGWMGWKRNTESVSLQRDAMVAMRIVEHRLRNASLDASSVKAVSWSGAQITFDSREHSVRRSFGEQRQEWS